MNLRMVITACSLPALLAISPSVLASSPFKKSFDEKYIKESGDEAFQAAFRKENCYVCHVKEKKKELFVNHYGNELAKLIPGNVEQRLDEARKDGRDARTAEKEKVLKELVEAMKKVEAIKSPSDVTYGELFKSRQLPPHDEEFSIE